MYKIAEFTPGQFFKDFDKENQVSSPVNRVKRSLDFENPIEQTNQQNFHHFVSIPIEQPTDNTAMTSLVVYLNLDFILSCTFGKIKSWITDSFLIFLLQTVS